MYFEHDFNYTSNFKAYMNINLIDVWWSDYLKYSRWLWNGLMKYSETMQIVIAAQISEQNHCWFRLFQQLHAS